MRRVFMVGAYGRTPLQSYNDNDPVNVIMTQSDREKGRGDERGNPVPGGISDVRIRRRF